MIAADSSRRDVLLGGMLLTAAAAAAWAQRRAQPQATSAMAPTDFDRAIPSRIGPYHRRAADEIVLPDRDGDSLAVYQQYVARTYVAAGQAPITLLIAYGAAQNYALQLHRPESCYPPAGFTLSPSRTLILPGAPAIDAVTLTARRIDRDDRLLYWTRIGAVFPSSLWAQRWVTLSALLGGHAPDGVLVRLSTGADDPAALSNLVRFNAWLLASVDPAARALLLGREPTADRPQADQRGMRHGLSTTAI